MATNNFSSGSIHINGNGNGNAVGNGNRLTYVNKTTINKYGGSGSGGHNGKGKDGGGELLIVGGIGSVIALAALSFWFTRCSEVINKILILFSLTSGGFGVLAAAKQFYESDYMEALRSFSVTAIAFLTYLSVSAASDTMPSKWADYLSPTLTTMWGPLRADWRIWLFPEYDSVPERAVFCRAVR